MCFTWVQLGLLTIASSSDNKIQDQGWTFQNSSHSLCWKLLTQEEIMCLKNLPQGRTWRKAVMKAPRVGKKPQQMPVQSQHFLQFIYSVSRSSPANQIRKCSESESHKLHHLCHNFPPTFPSFLFQETAGNTRSSKYNKYNLIKLHL